jgi:hypothetical protein
MRQPLERSSKSRKDARVTDKRYASRGRAKKDWLGRTTIRPVKSRDVPSSRVNIWLLNSTVRRAQGLAPETGPAADARRSGCPWRTGMSVSARRRSRRRGVVVFSCRFIGRERADNGIVCEPASETSEATGKNWWGHQKDEAAS